MNAYCTVRPSPLRMLLQADGNQVTTPRFRKRYVPAESVGLSHRSGPSGRIFSVCRPMTGFFNPVMSVIKRWPHQLGHAGIKYNVKVSAAPGFTNSTLLISEPPVCSQRPPQFK